MNLKLDENVERAEHNNRFHRYFVRIGYLVVITAALLSFWFFYQVFFPTKILDIKGDNFPVKYKEIRAGDKQSFEVQYCKYKNVSSNIQLSFIDGQLVSSFNTVRNFSIGCQKRQLDVNVPATLKEDTYYIEIQITYAGGFFGDEHHEFRTERFTVLPPAQDSLNNRLQILIEQLRDFEGRIPTEQMDQNPSFLFPTPQTSPAPNDPQNKSLSQNQNTNPQGQGQQAQPEQPSSPPAPPPPPDNDGVVVDLPLLPKIHIPSPL